MADIQAITFSGFGDKAWQPFASLDFAAGMQVAGITASELRKAVGSFLLGFLPGERPTFVALLGLRQRSNLFVGLDGKWRGPYVPAVLRSYPFRLLTAGNGEFALGYDVDSGLLRLSGRRAVLQRRWPACGSRSPDIAVPSEYPSGLEAATLAVEKLQAHDVLEPWPIRVGEGEGLIGVDGLLRVNEARLNALGPDALADLRDSGALALAYAHLLSTDNTQVLAQLETLHAHETEAAQKHQKQVASTFGLDTDGTIQIDWDAVLSDGKL